MKAQISASDFEAAAISAAMAMEKNAVRLYSERAEASEDPDEKAYTSGLPNGSISTWIFWLKSTGNLPRQSGMIIASGHFNYTQRRNKLCIHPLNS